jgi:hypothetical protein
VSLGSPSRISTKPRSISAARSFSRTGNIPSRIAQRRRFAVSRSSPASNDFACCARLTALSASVGGSTAAVSTAGPTLFGWLERIGGAGDGSRSARSRTKRSSSRLRCARAPDPAHCYALPAPLGGLFARGQHVAGYGRQAAVPPLRPFPQSRPAGSAGGFSFAQICRPCRD